MHIENNNSNFYMYLLSILGIGMCIFVFQIGYEKCMKNCGYEDPISEIFDSFSHSEKLQSVCSFGAKKDDKKNNEEYKDIEMEYTLHQCSKCKRGIGRNTNVYCFMDKHFCCELCRDQFFDL